MDSEKNPWLLDQSALQREQIAIKAEITAEMSYDAIQYNEEFDLDNKINDPQVYDRISDP